MIYSLEDCDGGVCIRRVNGVSTAVFIGKLEHGSSAAGRIELIKGVRLDSNPLAECAGLRGACSEIDRN